MLPKTDGMNNNSNINIGSPVPINGDSSVRCRLHPMHELQIRQLEEGQAVLTLRLENFMKDILNRFDAMWSPKVVVAILGCVAATVSAFGSIAGALLVAYLKTHGYM